MLYILVVEKTKPWENLFALLAVHMWLWVIGRVEVTGHLFGLLLLFLN